MEVILRHDAVEEARAGDKAVFTGSLLVVPEMAPSNMAGDRTELGNGAGKRGLSEGVSGLRAWVSASSSTALSSSRTPS